MAALEPSAFVLQIVLYFPKGVGWGVYNHLDQVMKNSFNIKLPLHHPSKECCLAAVGQGSLSCLEGITEGIIFIADVRVTMSSDWSGTEGRIRPGAGTEPCRTGPELGQTLAGSAPDVPSLRDSLLFVLFKK